MAKKKVKIEAQPIPGECIPASWIFIPGNVPSSKNNKVWTGEFLVSSPQCHRYYKNTKKLWEQLQPQFKTLTKGLRKPYLVSFHFVRDSRRKYDWVNPLQTIQDLMVTFNWIEDDNTDILMPVPIKINKRFSTYDPQAPGVYICISRRKKNF